MRPQEVELAESHRTYPSGKPELLKDLQREVNDLANRRLDNIDLALDGRWKVVRGRGVDLQSLQRSVPGGIVLTDRLDDIEQLVAKDVTASAYAEQDRIYADLDETQLLRARKNWQIYEDLLRAPLDKIALGITVRIGDGNQFTIISDPRDDGDGPPAILLETKEKIIQCLKGACAAHVLAIEERLRSLGVEM